MRLRSQSIREGHAIPGEYAFGIPDPDAHMRLGGNRNPHIAWDDLPSGTKSLVLVCHDPDVPSEMGDVNREDREIPKDLPRIDFYHWVLADLSPTPGEIAEGAFSDGVTEGGKSGPEGPHGTRQGLNNYTDLFEGDAEMGGEYFGYDGPCPPWNDSIVHRYIFTLYALDVERAPIEGTFRGPDLIEAIQPHILDQARMTGLYSLNPRVPA